MRAITVIPGRPDSVALTDMPEPPGEDGAILVQTEAMYAWCGTGDDAAVVAALHALLPVHSQEAADNSVAMVGLPRPRSAADAVAGSDLELVSA